MRRGIILVVIAASVLAAAANDLFVPPGYPVRAAYVIPMLIAAYFYSPRSVAVTAGVVIVVQVVGLYVREAPRSVWPYHVAALAAIAILIGGLSCLLARQREETSRHARAAEVQRRRLRAVIDHASAGIAVLGGEGLVHELVNPAYQALAAGQPLLGRRLAEAAPELAAQVLPIFERALKTGEAYRAVDMPLQVRRGPGGLGGEAYFTLSVVPLDDGGGLAASILAVIAETTEQVQARRQVEELARAAERRAAELRSVLENMVEGVLVWDAEGRVALANGSAGRMLGSANLASARRRSEELPGLLRLRHPDGRPMAPNAMAICRALAGQTVVSEAQVLFNPETQRDVHIRVSAAPIRDEEGRIAGGVVVIRDVTELTELERLKDQFIEVAAHELKTPVTAMKGYAQLLLRPAEVDAQAPQRKMLEAIDRGASQIDGIVRQLLDISRLHVGLLEWKREPVDLAGLVVEAIDQLAMTTSKHRIRLVRAERATVLGDPERLEQVLGNLLDNAIRYSPLTGEVEVAVSVGHGEAIVSVRDHGVGIPKEKQTRIFERFYRAHTRTPHDYGGMGIGLAISREIIARHGGRIWFESQEGRGSEFSFSLPLV